MPSDPTICRAIYLKKLVEFDYFDGSGARTHRVVEPYTHGYRKGIETLRGFHTRGTDATGIKPLWRPFIVARMKNLRMLDTSFAGEAPGYKPGDPEFERVCCQVRTQS
jgi:predicted DNA-binding transcriptional regulator YafY